MIDTSVVPFYIGFWMNKRSAIHCNSCKTRGQSIFCDLNEDFVEELNKIKVTNIYKPHQMVFYERNIPMGLYCVSKGKVKLYKTDIEGHQQILRLAGPGDVLGYRALLAGELYSASAQTIEEAELCFMEKRFFFKILESSPRIAFHVMELLSKNLRDAEEQVTNIVHKNIRERLAELFLVFRGKYGERVEKGTLLNIQLTREELAELVGTTQESVIRLISEFKKDGYIAVDGRAITLLNLNALTEMANLSE